VLNKDDNESTIKFETIKSYNLQNYEMFQNSVISKASNDETEYIDIDENNEDFNRNILKIIISKQRNKFFFYYILERRLK